MELLSKQENAIYYLKDKNTTEILYGGAAGGGKSALGCLWLIECAQRYPGSRWVMGRSKLKTLKETTLNTFFELSSKLNLKNTFQYNDNKGLITFFNKSEIILKDLFLYPSDFNFDSLGSLEITGAFVDECNQIVYKAWQILKSRIRYKLNEYKIIPKILGTCNPSKGWVYKEFYKPEKLTNDKIFIQALPNENPYLPESYLKSLLSLDKDSRERLYYGNWEYDDDPRTLIGYDRIISSINSFRQPQRVSHISADIARYGRDNSVVVLWDGWDAYIYKYTKQGVDEMANVIHEFANRFSVSKTKIVIDDDGVGGGVTDILRCKGFINNSRPVPQKRGPDGLWVPENYSNLKSQCYFLFAEMVNIGIINIFTSEGDLLSEELEQVKQAQDEFDTKKLSIVSKDEVKHNIGRSPDMSDALMMRMYFELKPVAKFADANY